MKIRILMLVWALVFMSAQGRVEYPIALAGFEKGAIENNTFWYFGRQSVIEEHSRAWCRQDSNVVFENFGDCVRAYVVRGDSLIYRAYNKGRSERMLLDNQLLSASLPFRLGHRNETDFSAHGLLFRDIPTYEEGTYTSEIISRGSVIINGDTIREVTLSKEEFVSTKTIEDATPVLNHKLVVVL